MFAGNINRAHLKSPLEKNGVHRDHIQGFLAREVAKETLGINSRTTVEEDAGGLIGAIFAKMLEERKNQVNPKSPTSTNSNPVSSETLSP